MASKEYVHQEFGPVTITKRRGSKSVRLRVTPDGTIKITLPPWVPYSAGLAFLEQKRAWVTSELGSRSAVLEPGQMIGRDHILQFIPDDASVSCRVRTTTSAVRVHHPVSCSVYDHSVQAAAVRGSKKALQQQAEASLPNRLKQLSELTGLSYESVSIRQLKSRWGSCSSSKHVTLNYFLMVLPDALVDYVLIHELAHTQYMNHSRDFWNLVGTFIADVPAMRRQMRQYQPSVFTALA